MKTKVRLLLYKVSGESLMYNKTAQEDFLDLQSEMWKRQLAHRFHIKKKETNPHQCMMGKEAKLNKKKKQENWIHE